MRPGFNRGVAVSIGVLILLLIGAAWLDYHTTRQLNVDAIRVAQTVKVMRVLEEVASTMKDAQTSVRGFVITGDVDFLKLHESASAAIENHIRRLKQLTADNPRQQARISPLQMRVQDELAILARAIALGKNDLEAARRAVKTGEGARAMGAIRSLIDEIEQDEEEQLRAREQQFSFSYHVAAATGVLTTFLGLAMVGVILFLLQRDLVARTQATAFLSEQREWFRTTLASIGDAVITTDTEGRVNFLNAVARSLTGWEDADAIGQPVAEVFHIINEKSRQRCEDPVTKVLESGVVAGLANHTILIGKNGKETSIADSGAPIRDADNRITGVVLVFRDVTAENVAQNAIRESEERLRFALEGIGAGAWDLDLVDHTAHRSLQHDQIFGYQELLPQWTYEMFLEHVTQEDRELVDQNFRQAIEARRNWDFDCRIIRHDGAVRWIRVSGRPSMDESGNPRCLVGIVQDITDRKQAEQELAQSRQRIAGIVDSAMDAIITIDNQQRIVLFNRAAETMFRYPADQVIGTSIDRFIPPRFREVHREHIRQFAETGQTGRAMGRLNPLSGLRADGEEFPIEASISQVQVGRNKLFTVILRDITERKRAEEELRQSRDILETRVQQRTADLVAINQELRHAKEEAETANRAKSTFLANMSHEIRTPMNAVIGMTELVLKTPLALQQREFLMTVKDSGEALLSVINDILDFSKIEAGKLSLESTLFNLRENLGDTMKSFALRAHQQGLELTCFIHPEVPHMVIGDYGRLRQIVVNLVGNALKFTEKGEVSLEVMRESESEDDMFLHFTVSDTGIGIPKEKQATIFGMFEQVDASTRRRHGGTGLGLAIAAKLVALMDGRIWVKSEVGRGSEFHFIVRLRLADAEPTESITREPASLHGMRVLVVDDNATNRRILEEVLKNWKIAPTSVSNAQDAMNLLQQSQEAETPYRLVVTDARMPNIDGFMLAEQIKQNLALGSTVIMMLTSGDRPDDIAECERLGISAYLLKPVKQSELLESIELALGITASRDVPRVSAVRQATHVRNLHILLAEDSLVNQKLAVALLEGQGHKVTVVGNGKEAVAAAVQDKFDVLLMDVQMPEMDGLEATEQIRTMERLSGAHLPIIAMTAYALKGDRERCLEAGMDSYITKPIRAEELFDTMDAAFTDRKREAVSASPPTVVNWPQALQAAQGTPAVLKSMTEAALEELPRLMTAIREAIAAGDAAKLRLAAHTLKGSVGYFGACQVCHSVAKLEDMASKGELADAETIVAELEGDLAQLLEVLSRHA